MTSKQDRVFQSEMTNIGVCAYDVINRHKTRKHQQLDPIVARLMVNDHTCMSSIRGEAVEDRNKRLNGKHECK